MSKKRRKKTKEEKLKPESKDRGSFDLEQRIYQVEGILKTLNRKLEEKEIEEKQHAKQTKKLRQELADLYEKKIKRNLES